ncbi:MAG TPA: TetR family transcriptional regulator C-terminal domain-containing protein [Steroidobacteraceae bacterium]|nr:TetR family transcriptional regulator C-terminal domain-containing protein [Steroidobacteraceae bacterium]
MSKWKPVVRAKPREQRERQLINAALECISTLGLSDTTVQAVAAEAGMAVGSISQYFDNKSRLLTAVLRQLSEEFEHAWRQALADCDPDPARRLGAFVRCYFQPALCQRRKIAVWFAFWGEVKAQPHYQEVCARYDRLHDETLESLCAALIEAGGYRERRAREAAKLIASMCQGLWLELVTGRDRLKRTELTSLALDGLGALFPRHVPAFALETTVRG